MSSGTTNPLFEGMENLFSSPKFATKDLLSLNPLTPVQSNYLKKCYTMMTAGIATSIVASLYGPHINPSMALMGQFALVMYISAANYREHSVTNPSYGRPAAFMLLCAIVGCMMSPLIEMVNIIDPGLVNLAALASLAVFVSLSFASILNFKSRTFLYLGSSIASFAFYLSLVQLANWWFNSKMVFDITSLASFGLTLLYTLYDTQVALASVEMGREDVVGHSLMFYFNLVHTFMHILTKLAESKNDDDDRRKKN
eukprot:GHVH01003921.1.p1 GENE.GHVH01003921.1~~GHVH01003921.1.p1  ORF type:complete len:255 (+),score=36.10 GHVH01003921.1:98-862(+)